MTSRLNYALDALSLARSAGRELAESAALASVLREPAALKALLRVAGCDWAVGQDISVRCEARLPYGQRADIRVEWRNADNTYLLLIENKPYCFLTRGQPRGYVRALRSKTGHTHRGLLLLYTHDRAARELKKRTTKLLRLRERDVRDWRDLDRRAQTQAGFGVYRARLKAVAAGLRALDLPPSAGALAHWFSEWHRDYEHEVSKAGKRAVKELRRSCPDLKRLLTKSMKDEEDYYFGYEIVHVVEDGKTCLLWLGTEPGVAGILGLQPDTVMLQAIGWWKSRELRLLRELAGSLGRALVPHSGYMDGPWFIMELSGELDAPVLAAGLRPFLNG